MSKTGGPTPDFIVHDTADNVGVIVVENADAGRELTGWVMDSGATLRLVSRDPIPLGHKIALGPVGRDATIIKYAADIGRTVAPIEPGGHVHVHNLKTKRW